MISMNRRCSAKPRGTAHRSIPTTVICSSRNSCDVRRPIPEAAPVTTATFPSSPCAIGNVLVSIRATSHASGVCYLEGRGEESRRTDLKVGEDSLGKLFSLV